MSNVHFIQPVIDDNEPEDGYATAASYQAVHSLTPIEALSQDVCWLRFFG